MVYIYDGTLQFLEDWVLVRVVKNRYVPEWSISKMLKKLPEALMFRAGTYPHQSLSQFNVFAN